MGTFSNQVLKADDELWTQINALNPMYRAQLDPYLTMSYTPGLMDYLFQGQFRTGYDKARDAARAKIQEVLAGLSNDVFQNTYNAAPAQASRQRDAGLNPDLAGSAEGEAAAGMDQPSSLDTSSLFQPSEAVDYQQQVLSAMQGALSLAQGTMQVQDVMSQLAMRKFQTEQIDIANGDDMMSYILSKYANIPPEPLIEAFEKGTLKFGEIPNGDNLEEFDGGTLDSAGVSVLEDILDFHTPEAKDRYRALVKKLKNSPSAQQSFYQSLRDMYKNRRESQIQAASKFSVDDVNAVNDENMKYLTDCHDARLEYENELSIARSAYEAAQLGNATDYENLCKKYGIPEAQVSSESANLLANKINAKFEQAMGVARKNMVSRLRVLSNRGNTWAQYNLGNWVTGTPLPTLQQTSSFGLMNVADQISNNLNGAVTGNKDMFYAPPF